MNIFEISIQIHNSLAILDKLFEINIFEILKINKLQLKENKMKF